MTTSNFISALAIGLLFAACSKTTNDLPGEQSKVLEQLQAPAQQQHDTAAPMAEADTSIVTHLAVVTTSKGKFTLGLYGDDAPHTVENFSALVRKRYYDGVLFHRVAADFIIQAGDPTTRDASARAAWGTGGQTANGEPLLEELNVEAPSSHIGYELGVLAMARKQTPGTATSQFFICLDKASVLPHQYTIFGRVVSGIDVVRNIGAVAVDPGPLGNTDGVPKQPIVIHSIRITRTSL